MFYKIDVLKNFAKTAGKPMCRSLFFKEIQTVDRRQVKKFAQFLVDCFKIVVKIEQVNLSDTNLYANDAY